MKLWLTLGAAVLLAACERTNEAATADSGGENEPGLSRVTEEGPVKMTVALSPTEPRLGDPLTLTLTVESEPGVTVEMPAFGEALGRFSILDFTPRQQAAPDGSNIASQRYRLQAPMSGRQRIPPLRIEFHDGRPGRDDDEEEYRELLSEELNLTIASVLPEGAVSNELRPPRPSLAEFQEGFFERSWPWLLAGVLVAGGALGALFWWQRRSAERARITAYDRAMRRLERLESDGLPAAEAADAWYVELSDIVRRFIEDQYGLRAPELTSEEFLQEARGSAELSNAQRELLPAFLDQCDRVKFAAYSPERSESRDALGLARRFFGARPVVAEAV